MPKWTHVSNRMRRSRKKREARLNGERENTGRRGLPPYIESGNLWERLLMHLPKEVLQHWGRNREEMN